MADFDFVLPHNKDELLIESNTRYFVRDLILKKELPMKLQEARRSLKEDGAHFIIEHFPTYFTLYYNADDVQMNLLANAYQDLHIAAHMLKNNIDYLLTDKDSISEENKLKYSNVLKMILYVYTNIVGVIEYKHMVKNTQTVSKKYSGKKKEKIDDLYNVDKQGVVVTLNNIIQQDINIFWDPPVVEELLISMVSEICYRFLENPVIKFEHNVRTEIFNTLGTLLKSYSHGVAFVVRMAQLVKTHEHLITCVATGIKLVVEEYNCKSLLRDFVREITEWQADENFQDAQSTRHCSSVLSEMATLMPSQMISEVMYLNQYLGHDSHSLRISVINVIAEIVLKVLSKPELNEEEKEYRNDFLAILQEHIFDVSAQVRSKVVQHWAKLQQDDALPMHLQVAVLENIIALLRDKSAIGRKSAASCVTSFLEYNRFGAQLQLSYMEEQARIKTEEFEKLKEKLETVQHKKLKELDVQWKNREADIRRVIESCLEQEMDEEIDEEMPWNEVPELIRNYIMDNKFEEAFKLCKTAGTKVDEWAEMRESLQEEDEVNLYLTLMQTFFLDIKNRMVEIVAESVSITAEDLNQLESLRDSLSFFKNAEVFLKLIDSAIKPMKNLLESVSIGDMHEAVRFFTVAYQFRIDNAGIGILEMLNIMKRSEQERKDAIINAFKVIFLTTNTNSMKEHTQVIVDRLIDLIKIVPFDNVHDLRIIISEWVSKGTLDNSVIDMLWQYFTKKIEVSDSHSLAALQLLTMASAGRRSIIARNVKLVSGIAFGERGSNDLLLVGTACQILAIVGDEKINMTGENLPFKIKNVDVMWENILKILIDHFPKRTQFYNYAITHAVDCIYSLCSKPDLMCEKLIEAVLNNVNEEAKSETIDFLLLTRLNHISGEIAIKVLNYLDGPIYRELKRRNYIREGRKNDGKKQVKKRTERSFRTPSSIIRANLTTSVCSTQDDGVEESTLDGAQADDTDAEFILDVLENRTVTGSGGLAKLVPYFLPICEKPDVYCNKDLQLSAITNLLRFMVVSSKFCEQQIQLLFTILERTPHADVKCNILIHLSDLLQRFPNVVEPWTPHIYDRLKDNDFEVRRTSFHMLANLILRDLVRVNSDIFVMAICIVEKQNELRDMSRNFFTSLATRGNHLYNVIPDIFSHLTDESNVPEDDLRAIMKFLFNLIDKNKQMDNLVDRFCVKFTTTEDPYKCKNISYCLLLIQYSEKGVRKLLDSFDLYKPFLQNNEVHAVFKQIISACNKSLKNEVKTLTAELEEKINSVFEIDNDAPNTPSRKVPSGQSKTTFKKPKGRPLRKKSKRKVCSEGDNSDEDAESGNDSSTVRKSIRVRTQRKVQQNFEDSDSE